MMYVFTESRRLRWFGCSFWHHCTCGLWADGLLVLLDCDYVDCCRLRDRLRCWLCFYHWSNRLRL